MRARTAAKCYFVAVSAAAAHFAYASVLKTITLAFPILSPLAAERGAREKCIHKTVPSSLHGAREVTPRPVDIASP